MFKKLHITPAIFKLTSRASGAHTLDEKMDDIIRLLADKNLDAAKKNELQERFNSAMRGDDVASTSLNEHHHWLEGEMDIILSRRHTKKLTYKKNSRSSHISVAFRMIISVLLITLGFAMIILPTPPSFEIYTIYYFTNNDGFTVMDLISLIIVFCGIYTLITAKKSSNKS